MISEKGLDESSFDGLSQQNYDKGNWLKVEFSNKVKRINGFPSTLDKLLSILKKRFRDLNDLLLSNPNLKVSLYYEDQFGDEMEILDTSDLLHAYRYAEKDSNNKVLKFVVEVIEQSSPKRILQQSPFSKKLQDDL
jgi:hypothetical protein